MASGNPTLDAAESSTGTAPLNTGPSEPQPPQDNTRPRDETIPMSLTSLPTGCTAHIFPLSESPKLDTVENVSTLPSARGFEELVRAEIRPPGPARAEETSVEEWGRVSGAEYAELVLKVQEAAGGGEAKVYKLVAGVGKEEFYVAALDVNGERILAVRVAGMGA